MRFLIWGLLIIAVLARFFLTLPKFPEGQRVRIIERVTTEPIRYSYNQGFNLLGLKVYLPKYPEVSYGDIVVVEGIVEGNTLTNAKLVEVREGTGPILTLRKKLVVFYQSSLPQPYSGLVAGVVLGSKSGLSESFWEKLKITSTAHVVVASGMNVSLVAGFLVGITSVFLPRRKAIPLAIGGVWIYSLLSGFDAPIIRAAIMGSIAFLAQAAGRLSTAWKGLFLSASIMLLIWPAWLSDLGFILSFVATASILLFEAKIKKFLSLVPNILRQDLSVTLAAQIGVAPIIYVTFGQFNLLSPVINVLVLWTVAPVTIIAGVSGIVGLLIPKLGSLLILLSYPLAFWFVKIIEVFS